MITSQDYTGIRANHFVYGPNNVSLDANFAGVFDLDLGDYIIEGEVPFRLWGVKLEMWTNELNVFSALIPPDRYESRILYFPDTLGKNALQGSGADATLNRSSHGYGSMCNSFPAVPLAENIQKIQITATCHQDFWIGLTAGGSSISILSDISILYEVYN